MKFVHAADLHLDSPLKGISASAEREPAVARALSQAGFLAWKNLVELCLDEQADFLVVAGDVFDGAQRALVAQFAFVDGLRRLDEAGIPAFVCHGNHDPLSGWAPAVKPPDSTVVFGTEVSEHRIERLRVRLVGKSYGERAEHESLVAAYNRRGDPAPSRAAVGAVCAEADSALPAPDARGGECGARHLPPGAPVRAS